MPERVGAPLFLLARFAEYYDEVVAIKLAIADGRLGAMLAVGDEPPPTEPADLAARTSARLAMTLLAQRNDIARTGTAREMDAYEQALYVMTALTDELFILETDWSGCDAGWTRWSNTGSSAAEMPACACSRWPKRCWPSRRSTGCRPMWPR